MAHQGSMGAWYIREARGMAHQGGTEAWHIREAWGVAHQGDVTHQGDMGV